jgi:uncharacterized protein
MCRLGMETAAPACVNQGEPRAPARTVEARQPPARGGIAFAGTLALVVLVIGGINWGLIGVAGIDVIAELFGPMSPVTRAIYTLVGVAAVYCIFRLPRWSRAG